MCLVTAAVAEVTKRCPMQVINIIRSTISNTDFRGPITAAVDPVKTHPSINLFTRNVWMATTQPAWCMSTTPVFGWTCRSHSCSCGAFKSEPPRMKPTVTLNSISVGHLSVSSVQTCIVLAFCGRINVLFPLSQQIMKKKRAVRCKLVSGSALVRLKR